MSSISADSTEILFESLVVTPATKIYKDECEPEINEHYKRFLLIGVSNGFFTELQDTIACTGCTKPSFFVRKIGRKRDENGNPCELEDSFCSKCYVEKFCNVHTFQNYDGTETHHIFKEKGGGGGGGSILYQSSPIIERSSGTVSGSN